MKKSFIAVLVLVCSLSSVNVFAQKADQASKNIKFYSKVWDVVINEGRVNILDTAYAENAVLHTVPETKGKANCIAYYANYVTGFSNRQFTVKETFAQGNKLVKYWQFKGKHTGTSLLPCAKVSFTQGNKLVKYWQFKGKHTGTFFGIPATNKDVDVIGCTIATIVNGKITEEQDFFDNLEFLQQLGIMPR